MECNSPWQQTQYTVLTEAFSFVDYFLLTIEQIMSAVMSRQSIRLQKNLISTEQVNRPF